MFYDIVNIKESDVQFFQEDMEILIGSSETDQFRDGARVVVAHTHSSCCPLAMLERYIKLATIDCKGDRFLFQGTCFNKIRLEAQRVWLN